MPLLAAAVLALVLANSPLAGAVDESAADPVRPARWVRRPQQAAAALDQRRPDGVFFLLVGLEIKREVVVGELSQPSQVALPIAGALGGMAVPAAIYVAFNWSDPAGAAAAGRSRRPPTSPSPLGVLAALGSRVPPALKVFLRRSPSSTISAPSLIIAIFYTADLSPLALALAAALHRRPGGPQCVGVRRIAALSAARRRCSGCAVLKSGVHATLAGVVLALFIPLKSAGEPRTQRPAIRLEHVMKPWSAWLDHAGLRLRQCRPRRSAGLSLASLAIRCRSASWPACSSASRSASCWARASLIALGVAAMPAGATWRAALRRRDLGGIGFTMSLFIGTLAFDDATREAAGAAGRAGGLAAVGGRWAGPCSARSANPRSRARLRGAPAGLYFPAMRRTSYEQMNCSIASALDVVGEPWTLLIVRDAFYGVRRFDDFQENLGIARNVLTARLKKLVEAGIFRKTAYRQRPLRHEYRLTDKGAALFTVIVGLKQWGDRYGAAARSGKPMDLVNRGDGRPLEPVLIDADSAASGWSSPTCAPSPAPAPTRARAPSSSAWRLQARTLALGAHAVSRDRSSPASCRRGPTALALPRRPCRRPSRLGAAEAPAVGIRFALASRSRLVLAGALRFTISAMIRRPDYPQMSMPRCVTMR